MPRRHLEHRDHPPRPLTSAPAAAPVPAQSRPSNGCWCSPTGRPRQPGTPDKRPAAAPVPAQVPDHPPRLLVFSHWTPKAATTAVISHCLQQWYLWRTRRLWQSLELWAWRTPVPSRSCKVFVGSLPHGVSDRTLLQEFGRYGEINDVFVKPGCARGRQWAFVTFASSSQTKWAIAATHHHL